VTIDEHGRFAVTSFRLRDGAYEMLEELAPAPEECARAMDAEAKARARK